MDKRGGAFESPMSRLLQEFLFVFIAHLENFSHPLEVESFGHFEAENDRIFYMNRSIILLKFAKTAFSFIQFD